MEEEGVATNTDGDGYIGSGDKGERGFQEGGDSTRQSGRELWNGISQKVKIVSVLGAFRTLRDMCEDCFVDSSQLTAERLLGEGSFAHVDLSVYEAPWGPMRVAVKRLKPKIFGCRRDVENFITEARLCKKLRNTNIVETLGVGSFEENAGVNMSGDLDALTEGSQPKHWYIVQEWMNQGSLKALVLEQLANHKQEIYTAKDALKWLTQVSKGLLYLHTANPRVIHRDIKLDNILLTKLEGGEVVAKIGDFGLSAIVPPAKGLLRSKSSRTSGFGSNIEELESTSPGDDLYNLHPGTGSLLYMAPEVLGGTPYNEKADVFSFAIVIFELFHKSTMFSIVSNAGSARDVELHALRVMGGYRPPLPATWPTDIKSLIEDCWADVPAQRPSMKEISSRLQDMQNTDFWSDPSAVLEIPGVGTDDGEEGEEQGDSHPFALAPEESTAHTFGFVEDDFAMKRTGCFCFFRDATPRILLNISKGKHKSEQ